MYYWYKFNFQRSDYILKRYLLNLAGKGFPTVDEGPILIEISATSAHFPRMGMFCCTKCRSSTPLPASSLGLQQPRWVINSLFEPFLSVPAPDFFLSLSRFRLRLSAPAQGQNVNYFRHYLWNLHKGFWILQSRNAIMCPDFLKRF